MNFDHTTCIYKRWDLTFFLCAHVVRVIFHKIWRIEDYVLDYYIKETFLKSYQWSIQLVNSLKFWPKTGYATIDPPFKKRMPERPKKKRIRED